nr:NADH dehydrogenase subunit 4L [Actornithophilus gracilis]
MLDLFSLLFFVGLLKFILGESVIGCLLSLEWMMISLFSVFCFVMMSKFFMSIAIVIFITVVVGESVLGLSILISIIRLSGSEKVKTLGLLK